MALVDIICVGALILFALLGAWRGFVRQVFSLLAFMLIALFAVPLGVWMAAPVIASSTGGPGAATRLRVGFALGAAVGIYIVTKVAGLFFEHAVGRRRAEGGPGLAPWNRWWGAALGVVKAGALCWLVLCFFTAFPKVAPGAAGRIDGAWAARTPRLFNPFACWILPEQRGDMEEALIALWQLKRHPAKWDDVVAEKTVGRVLKHDRLAGLLDAGQGDLVGALTDEEFRKSLREIDWGHIAEIANGALNDAEPD